MAIVGGIVGYIAVSYLIQATAWTIGDAESYWEAALRLRHGEPLYLAGIAAEDPLRYLYAPWFAAVWIPFTFLPKTVVMTTWSLAMLIASVLAITPLLRRRRVPTQLLAGLSGSFLVWTASRGNVQPLLVLALVMTLERRSGPLWVAVAASLKVVPILYAVVWAGRGEWRKVLICMALTTVLIAPAVFFNLAGYSTDAGARPALIPWLPAQVALTITALAISYRTARTRYAWVAAAVAAMLALPRFVEYNVTFALTGTVPPAQDQRPTVTPSTAC
jgi:hypothetical protein